MLLANLTDLPTANKTTHHLMFSLCVLCLVGLVFLNNIIILIQVYLVALLGCMHTALAHNRVWNCRLQILNPGHILDPVRPLALSLSPLTPCRASTLSFSCPSERSRPCLMLCAPSPRGAVLLHSGLDVPPPRGASPRRVGGPCPALRQAANVSVPPPTGEEDPSVEEDEEVLTLLYDPCLNCYFDPQTGKYYELV